MNLNVIYYIFINPQRDWKIIVKGQLQDFQFCKIEYTNFYIHVTCENIDLIEECKQLIDSFNLNVTISMSTINQYEYPGLKLLYELSNKSSDIFLYFHTKGMVFNNNNDLINNNLNHFNKLII